MSAEKDGASGGMASTMGAVAAAAGLFAAVAPLLRWFEVDISMPGAAASVSTTGWGSTAIDAPYPVPGGPTPGWDGWALADIPDGAVASVLAVILAFAGLRLAVGAGRSVTGRRTPQAAGVTAFGVLGLVWMVVSWFSAQQVFDDYEELIGGMAPSQDAAAIDDLFSLGAGSGFIVCALAFGVAALCGLAALWSTSIGDARPLDDPNARPLLPDGYVPPPTPVGASPSAEPPRPAPPSPPGGWL